MLTIRLAKACDIPAVARVHVAAVRALCRKHYRPKDLARWVDQGPGLYAGLLRSTTAVVAELDGVVVGFAAASLSKGYVRAVYVAPGHAGAGIGGRLLARIERAARVLGVRKLRLDATLNAVPFYMRAGYRSLGRGRTALGLGCVRMVKPLPVAKSPHGQSLHRPPGKSLPPGLNSPVRRPSRGVVDMGRRPRLT